MKPGSLGRARRNKGGEDKVSTEIALYRHPTLYSKDHIGYIPSEGAMVLFVKQQSFFEYPPMGETSLVSQVIYGELVGWFYGMVEPLGEVKSDHEEET